MKTLWLKGLMKASPDLGGACLGIAEDIKKAGGRAFFVGGCVRDFFLSQTPKDIDIEVFGLESKKLQALLSKKYELIKVGKAFGVFKVRGYGIDISLPRLESKMGEGHKGFE